MKENPKIAIVLLTFNQKEKTLRCLRSLKNISYKQNFILLFDNGSNDNTISSVKEEFPEVITHYSLVNLGVASGRNAAAEIACNLYNPEYFLFLDNDTTVEEDFLEKLILPLENDKSIAITTSKIKFNDGSNLIFAAGGSDINFWLGITSPRGKLKKDNGRFDEQSDCIASGGCMLVRSKIFFEVNGFDPVYNPYGPEDLDFVYRIMKRNYRSIYVPQSVIYHDPVPSRSFSGGEITPYYLLIKTRNIFTLVLRHGSLAEKIFFTIVAAPLKFFGMFFQALFKGNMKSISAIFKGFLEFTKLREKKSEV